MFSAPGRQAYLRPRQARQSHHVDILHSALHTPTAAQAYFVDAAVNQRTAISLSSTQAQWHEVTSLTALTRKEAPELRVPQLLSRFLAAVLLQQGRRKVDRCKLDLCGLVMQRTYVPQLAKQPSLGLPPVRYWYMWSITLLRRQQFQQSCALCIQASS